MIGQLAMIKDAYRLAVQDSVMRHKVGSRIREISLWYYIYWTYIHYQLGEYLMFCFKV